MATEDWVPEHGNWVQGQGQGRWWRDSSSRPGEKRGGTPERADAGDSPLWPPGMPQRKEVEAGSQLNILVTKSLEITLAKEDQPRKNTKVSARASSSGESDEGLS